MKKVLILLSFIFGLFFITTSSLAQSCNTGDGNGDGKVDGFDYVIWWQNFSKNISGPQNGDYNCSGYVDGFDYVIWWQNFGRISITPTPTSSITPFPTGTNIGYFTVSVADESFCLYLADLQQRKLATDNYHGLNNKIPVGKILSGSGGFNFGFGGLPGDKYWRWWSWHMDPDKTIMADSAIEICDALPSYIEYSGSETGTYCPWLAKVTALSCPSGN